MMLVSRFHLLGQAVIAALLCASASTAAEGFYKDLFMDGGSGLTSRTTLPAADHLNLSWERLSTGNRSKTLEVMAGSPIDSNGALLYPDNQPRFRAIFVNGGQSRNHGDSLGPTGRKRLQDFYYNGGSYVGSCAGAIMASINATTGRSSKVEDRYLHIYPARTHYAQLNAVDGEHNYTDMLVPDDSPLLDYYSFGSENRIQKIRHNGGVFVIKGDNYFWAPGTEILATYATPVVGPDSVYRDLIGNASVWAYKGSGATGRLVLGGSHPEGLKSGNGMRLFAGMLEYALDGVGKPRLKASLKSGVVRRMDNNNRKGYEKIGDRQYHHFTVTVPPRTERLSVRIAGETGINYNLYLRKDGFAFASRADTAVTSRGASKSLAVTNPEDGTWYVGVECATTVSASRSSWGHSYTGNTRVLNGVEYLIVADVKNFKAGTAASPIADAQTPASLGITAKGSQVAWRLPVADHVRLSLLGLNGRLKATLSSGMAAAGMHTVDLRSLGIAPGTYLLRLVSGNQIVHRRVAFQ